jgi:methylmalonyl-CoA carboxyltransferase large subunit
VFITFAALLVVAVVVALGCVITYVSAQAAFRRRASEVQQAEETRLQSLAKTIQDLESRLAELSKAPAPVQPQSVVPQKQEEVSPEMIVVLSAAVTAFLGKKVRIRSAKMLQSPYEIVNPWSQQGRVIVQASHNLRPGG